jgi:hypothetical protein
MLLDQKIWEDREWDQKAWEEMGLDLMKMSYIREASMVMKKTLTDEKIPIEKRMGKYEPIFGRDTVLVKAVISNLKTPFKLPELLSSILNKITDLCMSGALIYEDETYHLSYFMGKDFYLSIDDFFYCESIHGQFILILNVIDTIMILNGIDTNNIENIVDHQTPVTIKYYNKSATFPNYYEYTLTCQDDIFITNSNNICIPKQQLLNMTVIDNEPSPSDNSDQSTPNSPHPLTHLTPTTNHIIQDPIISDPIISNVNVEKFIPDQIRRDCNTPRNPLEDKVKFVNVFIGSLEKTEPYGIMFISNDILYDIETQRSYRYLNKNWQRIEDLNYIFKSDLNKFVFFQDRTKTIIILPIEIPYYLFIRDPLFCHNKGSNILQCISYEFDEMSSKITKDTIINPNGEIIDLIHNGTNTFLLKHHIYGNFYIHKVVPTRLKEKTSSHSCCILL